MNKEDQQDNLQDLFGKEAREKIEELAKKSSVFSALINKQ